MGKGEEHHTHVIEHSPSKFYHVSKVRASQSADPEFVNGVHKGHIDIMGPGITDHPELDAALTNLEGVHHFVNNGFMLMLSIADGYNALQIAPQVVDILYAQDHLLDDQYQEMRRVFGAPISVTQVAGARHDKHL